MDLLLRGIRYQFPYIFDKNSEGEFPLFFFVYLNFVSLPNPCNLAKNYLSERMQIELGLRLRARYHLSLSLHPPELSDLLPKLSVGAGNSILTATETETGQEFVIISSGRIP